MERRYDLFSKKSRSGTYVIDIDEYNANLTEGEEKLPKIVLSADEGCRDDAGCEERYGRSYSESYAKIPRHGYPRHSRHAAPRLPT